MEGQSEARVACRIAASDVINKNHPLIEDKEVGL